MKSNKKWHGYIPKWSWMLWPLRFIMRIQLKPDALTKERFQEIYKGKDVIFILPRLYILDVIILNLTLRKLGHPKARVGVSRGRLGVSNVLGLRPKPGIFTVDTRSDGFCQILAELINDEPKVKKDRVVLLPVSIFWSRHAERSNRNIIMRMLFPDDAHATTLQKIAMLIAYSRNINIHFGSPIPLLNPHQLSEDKGRTSLEMISARRLRRNLLIEFNRERTAALGPMLYELDTIASWILDTAETRKILEHSGGLAKNYRKAFAYLREIAANYSYTAVRGYELVMDFLWTRIFKGVRVRNFELVNEVAKSGQIMWMPCHRSHLDYLLLSYLLTKKGLAAPHIAAGVNLNFWPVGPLFRRGGAFFIRRSFTGNKLYAHIFSQYVFYLLHNSFSIEFFHEGGRSRTGKLLAPKTGLTSIAMGSVIKRRAENTFIIPIYFGYDRVMEDDSYANELKGAKKRKESLFALLGAIRHLFYNYGRVDVAFGTPIRVGTLWEEYFSRTDTKNYADPRALHPLPSKMSDIPEDLDPRDPRIQSFVKFVANRVNQGINSTATASGSAILASCLLVQESKSISGPQLRHLITTLHGSINRLGPLLGWPIATSVGSDTIDNFMLTQESSTHPGIEAIEPRPLPSIERSTLVDEILKDGLYWKFLDKSDGDYVKNDEREMNLWWYRGTIFHITAVPGIVASLLLMGNAPTEIDDLVSYVSAIRRIWRDDLFWPDTTSDTVIVMAALSLFKELGLVEYESGLLQVTAATEQKELLIFFADQVRSERELYGLQVSSALAMIENAGTFAKDELLKNTISLHRTAFLRGSSTFPANQTQVFGGRVFDALYRAGVYVPGEVPNLEVAFTEIMNVSEFFELNYWKELARNI